MADRELKEVLWSDLTYTEQEDKATGTKRMRIQGVVQEADTVNRNKRIYPKAVLEAAVKKLEKKMPHRAFGEVDHPEWRGHLKDTSHLITKLWWNPKNDKQLMGEMLVMNTPAGQVLQEIVRAGGRPGFSSRGRGRSKMVKKRGYGEVEVVEPGFQFDAFDFVIDPSVRPARITKIMEQFKDDLGGTSEGGNGMSKQTPTSVQELRELYPDLVDELIAEEKSGMLEELKEEVLKENKGKEKKEKEELESRVAELEAEIAEKDAEIEKHLGVIEIFVSTLKDNGYLPKATSEEEDAEIAALKDRVAELEKEKSTLEKAVKEKEDQLAEIEEEKAKAEVQAHLEKETEGMPEGLRTLIRSRLEDAKTVDEVDVGLKNYKELIEAVQKGEIDVEGKGRGKREKETDKDGERKLRERMQARAGIKKGGQQ